MPIESHNYPPSIGSTNEEIQREITKSSLRAMEVIGMMFWIDPFAATKKKCIPTDIDFLSEKEKEWIVEKIVHYSTVDFTFDNRDWTSFIDEKMNNLIIDDRGMLLQLIFLCSPNVKLPSKQKLIQATEYIHTISKRTIARRFEKYI